MLSLALIAALLTGTDCETTLTDGGPFMGCAISYGIRSHAPLWAGSGAPDFECGEHDLQDDGGWGGQSKYCSVQTDETESYNGDHGDFTIAAKYPRTAGILFGIVNPYFGGHSLFSVAWNGDVTTYGSYYAYQNGGGIINGGSYVAVRGLSSNAAMIPDAVVEIAPGITPHFNKGYNFGVWTGATWALRVRDDGYLGLSNLTLKIEDTGDQLKFTKELTDGGTSTASISWSP